MTRELLLTVLRTTVAMLPAAIVAFAIWYTRQSYTANQHLEVAGFLAVVALGLLGLYTLRRSVYRVYGRMALAAFVTWAAGAAVFRALSFLGLINAETRLALNTVVAAILVFAGIYAMFTHRVIVDAWRALSSASDDAQKDQ